MIDKAKLSAGVVVVRESADGARFLLLRAYRNWDCPKGLVGAEEDPLDAAVRETREETGIEDLEFAWGREYYETPVYSGNKTARYYVARTRTEQVVLGTNAVLRRPEHHEYRWVDLGQALSLTVPRIQSAITWAAGKVASEFRIA